MKQKLRIGIIISITFCMLLSTQMVKALSVMTGQSFTVSVACGDVEGSIRASGANAAVNDYSPAFCDRGKSIQVTATAKNVGSATISIVGIDATGNVSDPDPSHWIDYSGKVINSVSVNVEEKQNVIPPVKPTAPTVDERSKNNRLSELTVSEGQLNPAFSTDITEYTVNLGPMTEKITIYAIAQDVKATINGVQEYLLCAGENIFTVYVTAENGDKKEYTIHVMVDETPQQFVKYRNEQLGIVRNLRNIPPLDGFNDTTIQINGKEVKAWVNENLGITLIYLQKGEDKNYYIYDSELGVVALYQTLILSGLHVVVMDIPDELQNRAGMSVQEVEIDGKKMIGFVFDDPAFSNYYLIYAMDDKGVSHLYQYEKTENTLQLYSDLAAITQESLEKLVKKVQIFQMISLVLGFVLLSCIGLTVYMKKNKDVK